MSICQFVPSQKDHFRRSKQILWKGVLLILPCSDTLFQEFSAFEIFFGFCIHPSVDQPTVDNGTVRKEGFLAVAEPVALAGHVAVAMANSGGAEGFDQNKTKIVCKFFLSCPKHF